MLNAGGASLTVIAGRFGGATAPVRKLSDLFYVHAELAAGGRLTLTADLGERALYVVDGAIRIASQTVGATEMAVLADRRDVDIAAATPARLMLLGGAPLDGKRLTWWNFVSSRPDLIEQAKTDWRERRFPAIPGDAKDFTPLPA